MPHRSDEPVDVGRLLDEGNWRGYQKWLVFLTAWTIVFDGIDNQSRSTWASSSARSPAASRLAASGQECQCWR